MSVSPRRCHSKLAGQSSVSVMRVPVGTCATEMSVIFWSTIGPADTLGEGAGIGCAVATAAADDVSVGSGATIVDGSGEGAGVVRAWSAVGMLVADTETSLTIV